MLLASCCCRAFAIAIWNSNAARDDNFKVLLNGTDIGHIDNNQMNYTGRIFSDHSADMVPAKFAPQLTNVFEATVALDMTLLINGNNALRIESIQNNHGGNFGKVQVGYWKPDDSGNYAADGTLLLNTFYTMPEGVGNGNDYTFTYP